MELTLIRTYHSRGTNGLLELNGVLACYTIELPWRDNKPQVSCIPEGTYQLEKRFSDQFQQHLLVKDVPDRSLILIRQANNAELELRGCISPVNTLLRPGCGEKSRMVFVPLMKLVYAALDRGGPVTLHVRSI